MRVPVVDAIAPEGLAAASWASRPRRVVDGKSPLVRSLTVRRGSSGCAISTSSRARGLAGGGAQAVEADFARLVRLP